MATRHEPDNAIRFSAQEREQEQRELAMERSFEMLRDILVTNGESSYIDSRGKQQWLVFEEIVGDAWDKELATALHSTFRAYQNRGDLELAQARLQKILNRHIDSAVRAAVNDEYGVK
ncbi:hypothetical protein A3765_28350 [Oleiphilus sp. HI0130]|nr:hypothetical protein A3765_28660 [Oleiphilus sp. HI0130]KZZ72464.1 hypothetical protein A3765_28350 [Oleiphilus sp. HI0130]